MKANTRLLKKFINSCFDLLPIIIVVLVFQIAIIRQPIPDISSFIFGMGLVALGLTFFVEGLEQSLFILGTDMAFEFTKKGSLFWLLIFAFTLGFGATVAEPALIAVANEAASVAVDGGIINSSQLQNYAFGLRMVVALSVGFAILIGVVRIIKGWPLHYLIIFSYGVIVIMTLFAPAEIIGIAYDSGGVTTSTITVPLVTVLGVGLASAIKGRNPMIDGFGLIAFASLTPMIFVIVYGMLI